MTPRRRVGARPGGADGAGADGHAAPGPAARGAAAEARARSELEALGWIVLDANVRARGGELDLVMRDGDTIVFVEVRQRTRATPVDALGSVGWRKVARVRRAAALWLARHALSDARVRFDVVAYDGPARHPRRTHLRDAF